MFTYLTNGKRNKAAQMAMAAMALSMLTSCHFGDIDDVRPKDYADVTRTFEISLDAITPSGTGTTRTVMIDQFTDGLEALWKDGDQIAMFSAAIDDEQNNHPIILTGGGSDPESQPTGMEYLSWAPFTGKGKLKVANNTKTIDGQEYWDETKAQAEYKLLYPGDKFKDLAADTASVRLDFKGQDGNLQTLAQNYEYAWARAKGIAQGHVSFGTLKLIDNTKDYCNIPNAATYADAHKNHDQAQNGGVVMDNKMSVIRFCLVHKDETTNETTSFRQYLEAANGGYQVTKITLIEETGGVLYSSASLNLKDGKVSGSTSEDIVIENANGITLKEIPNTGSNIGNELSWGSAFYVAIPVPNNQDVYDCRLEIQVTSKNSAEDNVAGLYYANFKNRTFKEGNYYLTAPIDCSKKEQAAIDNPIKIYLYHNSSLVYDVEEIEGWFTESEHYAVNNQQVGQKGMFNDCKPGDRVRIYFTKTADWYEIKINDRFGKAFNLKSLNNSNVIDNKTQVGREAAEQGYFEFTLTTALLDKLQRDREDPNNPGSWNGNDCAFFFYITECSNVSVTILRATLN